MQLTFHFESELTGDRESSELISSHLRIFYLDFKLVMQKTKPNKKNPPSLSSLIY